jgi:predicted nucleic acid-binding protein
VPFTALHELEVANAFALLLGRKAISAAEHRAVRKQVQEDLDARRLWTVAIDWADVFAAARLLSDAHSARLLTRSLDLLHVAAARLLGCRVFVSADDRQLAAARASGLKGLDIKRAKRAQARQ